MTPALPVPRRVSRLVQALAVLIFAAYAWRFFNNVDDDAFITMRYALNFWRGWGWTMNPGERVEGYTSPLHLWYLTVALRLLSPDATIFLSKAIGVGLGIHVLSLTRQIARRVYIGAPWIAEASVLLLALLPEFALSMTNAMETGFAVWLLACGIAAYLADRAQPVEKRPAVRTCTALWFAAAALTRPELIPVLPALLLTWAPRRPSSWRDYRGVLVGYALPLLLLLTFRLAYYQDVLPNTYYAKHMALVEAMPLGWGYYQRFALPAHLPLVGLALTVLGTLAVALTGRHRSVVFTVIALNLAFVLGCGGTWGIDGRFVAPAMPLLALVWTAPLALLERFAQRQQPLTVIEKPVIAACYTLGLILLEIVPRVQGVAAEPYLTDLVTALRAPAQPPLVRWKAGVPQGRRRLSDWIAAHARPGQLVAQTEMGLPSLMNRDVSFIDLRGLCDRTVARMATRHHTNVGIDDTGGWADQSGEIWPYLHARRPDWILLFDSTAPETRVPIVNGMYATGESFDIDGGGGIWTVQTWHLVGRPPTDVKDS